MLTKIRTFKHEPFFIAGGEGGGGGGGGVYSWYFTVFPYTINAHITSVRTSLVQDGCNVHTDITCVISTDKAVADIIWKRRNEPRTVRAAR